LLIASFAVAAVSAFPDDAVREKTFITVYGNELGTPGATMCIQWIHWAGEYCVLC
jgi:hypothetical protein